MATHEENGRYGTLGLIGKFQPPHKGHERLLDACLRNADRLLVGVGTREHRDPVRPFDPVEIAQMLETILRPRGAQYRLIEIPDYGHLPEYADGSRWHEHVKRTYAGVDAIVTGNPYVRQLLVPDFRIITPDELIGPSDREPICGSLVRSMMALNKGWESYIPYSVMLYIHNQGLDERLRQEFGTELTRSFPVEMETVESEMRKVRT